VRSAQLLASYQSPQVALMYLASMVVSTWFTLALVRTQIEVTRGNAGISGLAQLGTVLRQVPGALLGTLLIGLAVVGGMILLVIPGLILLIRWVLVSPALVDRDRGIFDAIGTSWNYVRGHWWRTATILTVVGVVAVIVAMVIGMVFGFIGATAHLDRVTLLLGAQITSAASQVLYWPAIVSALVAVYQDLKLRKEGGDIEARLQTMGSAPA
jgi:uncharacterized membrane protein